MIMNTYTYEKKYKDALEKAKSMVDDLRKGEDILAVSDLESMFPELKESEDERIRKDLIKWINEFPDTIWRGHYKKDVIAWLEKQCEKPNWSEEDEKRLQSCISSLKGKGLMGGVDTINSKWLKSLKPQPKQEWNEEDEQYLAICKNALHQYQTVNQWDEVTVIRWLEGKLKQRMEE